MSSGNKQLSAAEGEEKFFLGDAPIIGIELEDIFYLLQGVNLSYFQRYDKTVKVWDLVGGKEMFVYRCAFNADGTRAMSTSWDETVKVW
eukprot:CAMPEP_0172479016 /NCGR_PEP_ID=MMETSP1066-20121228/3306_1 /TAXON_ID=671091 /ORGANISM="Coscinodiscus wailesii, Strain CCMP2513" /LENGTH=88 /DNA_ID=CAMNT_0013239073 /DNA_START=446 /DNA_END=709 /DNA_ORIENTATION=+